MKTYLKYMLLALLALTFPGTSLAQETLKNFGDMQGRSYHQALYAKKACDACHGTKNPTSFPSDMACVSCHELEKLVQTTARPEEDKWQNPHNNLHYGKDVPCMVCHGEHETREVLCKDCHTFKYPKHKK